MKILAAKSKIDLDQIQPGRVLIARKHMNDELLHRSVILILEHDETGTTGIILNKTAISPSPAQLVRKEERIYYGGTYDTHRVGIILSDNSFAQKSIRISDGIYYSENCFLLNEKNFHEAMDIANLKAFIGFTVWKPGQLEKEIDDNNWWIDDFTFDELRAVKDVDLWEYKLLQTETMYGLFHNKSFLSLN
jgi:putative transcriptional regulator